MPPAALWGALSRTDDFPRWWSWLRVFESTGLEAGTVSRCVVRAPLPYSLRFTVDVQEVDEHRLVDAVVDGDIAGPARLEVAAAGSGSEARLVWTLELRDPLLRSAALVARPLMEWGHEWVVSAGVAQFRRRALVEGGASGHP